MSLLKLVFFKRITKGKSIRFRSFLTTPNKVGEYLNTNLLDKIHFKKSKKKMNKFSGSSSSCYSIVQIILCFMWIIVSVCDGYRQISTLDDFSGNQLLIGIISDSSVFPFTVEGYYESTSVIGGERDLELLVTSGPSGAVFTAGVNNDDLANSSPYMGSAFTVYQLDGIDASSAVNENGLGNFDLTFSGTATAFSLFGFSDIDTHVDFFIYTATGRMNYRLDIAGDFLEKQYIVEYSNFSGNGDFSNVGAIELQFNGDQQIDVQFSSFSVLGPEEE
jgi:hypothetical protein